MLLDINVEYAFGIYRFLEVVYGTRIKIKNKLGNWARLGNLASGRGKPASDGYQITELIN